MKKTILRTTATVAVLLATALTLTGIVEATAPQNYGWWYRLNERSLTGIPKPDPPQGVPEEGMYVARDAHPEEALGMAAMNFEAGVGTSATLELTVAEDYRQQATTAQIVACPTSGSFATEFGGLWENRPQAQCGEENEDRVLGESGGGGSVMIWDLPEAFQVFPGFWSFVLAPDCRENVGCDGDPVTQQPFQVAFEAPDEATLSVQGQDSEENQPPPPDDVDALDFGDEDGGAPPPSNGGTPVGGTGGGSTGGGTGDFGGTTGGGGFDAGTSGSTDDGADLGGADDFGPTTGGSDEESGFDSAAAPTGETDDSLARTVAIILLAVFGAGLWLASGFMARRPAIAGFGASEGVEEPEEGERGGLGRFIRRRTSGPRRLR